MLLRHSKDTLRYVEDSLPTNASYALLDDNKLREEMT